VTVPSECFFCLAPDTSAQGVLAMAKVMAICDRRDDALICNRRRPRSMAATVAPIAVGWLVVATGSKRLGPRVHDPVRFPETCDGPLPVIHVDANGKPRHNVRAGCWACQGCVPAGRDDCLRANLCRGGSLLFLAPQSTPTILCS